MPTYLTHSPFERGVCGVWVMESGLLEGVTSATVGLVSSIARLPPAANAGRYRGSKDDGKSLGRYLFMYILKKYQYDTVR